jgi:alanine racemase
VVKADAYGHGAVAVSRALIDVGAEQLAVAWIDEALALRAAAISAPILVFGGVPPSAAERALDLDLTAVVWDVASIRALGEAVPSGKRLVVHLKVDTGMTRKGADPAELAQVAAELHAQPLDVEGVMSHLACADTPSHPSFEAQRAAFDEALRALDRAGVRPRVRHLANSAGVLASPATHYDMVRPGIMLYGALPAKEFADRVSLRPVMELRTAISQIREVRPGTGIGYGHTFVAARPTRVAVLAIGYGQGYPRALSNRGNALVRGRLAPVIGIVSMDHTMIDVTDVSEAAVGDDVVLWGAASEPRIDVMRVGEAAGTLGYELLVGVPPSLPRVYTTASTCRENPARVASGPHAA